MFSPPPRPFACSSHNTLTHAVTIANELVSPPTPPPTTTTITPPGELLTRCLSTPPAGSPKRHPYSATSYQSSHRGHRTVSHAEGSGNRLLEEMEEEPAGTLDAVHPQRRHSRVPHPPAHPGAHTATPAHAADAGLRKANQSLLHPPPSPLSKTCPPGPTLGPHHGTCHLSHRNCSSSSHPLSPPRHLHSHIALPISRAKSQNCPRHTHTRVFPTFP